MLLSIIIVSWRVKDKLRNNLRALLASQTSFDFDVYVVDNNSEDGSVEMLRKEFPQVHLLVNKKNRGFAAANNQVLKTINSEFVLLLNPDMMVQTDTLEKSINWAQANNRAVVTTCKLLSQEGEIVKQVRRFPHFFDQLMITLKLPHIFPALIDNYLLPNFNYNQSQAVDSVRGAFFLINRFRYQKFNSLDQLLLDERYFIWFEEVDFCRQLHEWGAEVWYTPVASCIDYVGQSFKQVKRRQSQEYFSDSMLKYFAKWGKKSEFLLLKLVWFFVKIFI